jgi:lipopolysaccharide export system protein LptA
MMSRWLLMGCLLAGALVPGILVRAEPAKPEPTAVQRPAKPDKDGDRRSALGSLGGHSKEPIKIDADRLDVFDRENRAVFKGNVVAVQGETTIHCTALTVFYERGQGARPASPPQGQGDNAIKKIDCQGPVTVASKDQVATGNNATFDRVANKVVLTGNAALSQGQNVTRGERIVYDLNTGVANIEGGRVRAMFVPTGKEDGPKRGSSTAAPGSAEPKPQLKERVQAN